MILVSSEEIEPVMSLRVVLPYPMTITSLSVSLFSRITIFSSCSPLIFHLLTLHANHGKLQDYFLPALRLDSEVTVHIAGCTLNGVLYYYRYTRKRLPFLINHLSFYNSAVPGRFAGQMRKGYFSYEG